MITKLPRIWILFVILSSVNISSAQNTVNNSFSFTNSTPNDSVMLMASWWNSNARNVTYEAWIKPIESNLNLDIHRTRTILFKQHYGTSGIYLETNDDSTSRIKVVLPGISTPWTPLRLPVIQDNEWTYIALVINGNSNQATVWVNNQKVDSVFAQAFTSVNFMAGQMPGGDGNLKEVRPLTIGGQWPYYPGRTSLMPQGRQTVDRFFRGEIDEVRVWNVTRTDTQITQNIFKPLIGNEFGLLAYYNFENENPDGKAVSNHKSGIKDLYGWGVKSGNNYRSSLAMVRSEVSSSPTARNYGFDIEWNTIPGIDFYSIDVATDSLFTFNLPDYKGRKVIPPLNKLAIQTGRIGKFYFRINASLGNTASAYSPIYSVLVEPTPIESITIQSANSSAAINTDRGTLQLKAVISSSGLTDSTIIWSVDLPQLATINSKGLLTAEANGTVVVTAQSARWPQANGVFTVTVSNQAPSIWTTPTVKTPASLYWGGYKFMDQLVDNGSNWDFVKNYADGFLFHGAYWGQDIVHPEVPVVARKLSEILKQTNYKTAIELGWPGLYTQFQPTIDMARKKAQEHLVLLQKMKSWGITINEINVDWHMYLWKPLCMKHPDWTTADIIAWVTGDYINYTGPAIIYKPGYMPDYISTIRQSYPGMSMYIVDSPVWFWWDSFPSLGKSEHFQRFDPLTGYDPTTSADNNIPVLVNGNPVRFLFNWREVMQGVLQSSGTNGVEGFATDLPYDYVTWADKTARESNFNKVLTYESWFKSKNKSHIFICNTSDGDNLFPHNKDGWDKNYYEKSLATLYNYQIKNGRANQYLFESWYSGPFTVVPENKQYSYTNLVRDAIYYLKGIDQKLDLQIREIRDQTFYGVNEFQTRPYGQQSIINHQLDSKKYIIKLTNSGQYACFPMLKALQLNDAEWTINYYFQTTNISAKIKSDEGFTLTNLLNPGSSIEISVEVSPKNSSASGTAFSVWSFWNPQDPTGKIRDVVSVTYDTTMSTDKMSDKNIKININQSENQLNILFSENKKNITVRLYDVMSKLIKESNFNNRMSVQLCLDNNECGVHIVKITADGEVFTSKFLNI